MKPATDGTTKTSRASGLRSLAGARRLWWIAAVVALAGGYALWKHFTDPSPAWLVRWRLERYLARQSHTRDFKVEFPFPSKAEMSHAPETAPGGAEPRGTRTGKDFDSLREEYFTLKSAALAVEREHARARNELAETRVKLEALSKSSADPAASNAAAASASEQQLRNRAAELEKKIAHPGELQAREEALAPIVSDLWDFQRAWLAASETSQAVSAGNLARARTQFAANIQRQINQSGSYGEIYRLIGQELWVTKRLAASRNPEHQRAAIRLALEAARHALEDAQNGWVAGRICEGYVLPRLELADDPNRRSPFNPDNFLNECADIFRQNDEHNSVVRVYEIALAQARTPQRADAVRARLAMAYEQAGDASRALKQLRQIQDTNDYRWVLRRLPRLEQQAQSN